MALTITDLKKGVVFKLDNTPYKVVEYSQKVMGRGGSIVNVKIKSLIDGKVFDKTFKGNEQLDNADVVRIDTNYLYNDGQLFYFMDDQTFQQYEVKEEDIADNKNYLKEGQRIQILLFENQPIAVELPKNLAFKVIYTEDVVKGDTATNIQKDATIETGLVVKVPPFIKTNDVIRVDTRTGAYLEREK